MPCLGLPPTATITGPVRSTLCSVDGTHLILYPGGLPRLDTTRPSLNGVSGTEYASPGHTHPRYPYLLAALSSHFTRSPLQVDLRNRHTTLPWASIRAFSGRSSRPAYCTDAFKAQAHLDAGKWRHGWIKMSQFQTKTRQVTEMRRARAK
jgi:hypothetical protein